MDVALSGWFVILLAVLAANLPFVNERVFIAIPLARVFKPFWIRLLELIVLYLLVLGVAYILESHIDNVFSQRWEFYAITVCLFVVFAYPGFVFRYLRKRHGRF